MIQIVDNYYSSDLVLKSKKDEIEKYVKQENNYYALTTKNLDDKVIGEKLNITLNDYTNKKFPNNTFFSFFKDEEKKIIKNKMI